MQANHSEPIVLKDEERVIKPIKEKEREPIYNLYWQIIYF